MKISIEKSKINGEICAIPSKSYAHRICICDFFAKNEIRSSFNGFSSKDILATANCLNDIKNGKKVLDCNESGSTLRFLLPILSCLGGDYELTGKGKLMDRPNDELFSALKDNGALIKKDSSIKLSGKLCSGEFRLRGDISSQYVSGLLMALPNLNGDSKIILTSPLSSKPYVDITLEVLKEYNIKIEQTDYGYYVFGNQEFKGRKEPEGDWSNMSVFLALGALHGEVSVSGLNENSNQGDKKILDILSQFGAKITIEKDKITVKKDKCNNFSFDSDSCPDLVPIVCVLAAKAKGKSIIKNVQRLKIKESDRILSSIKMLESFSIKAIEKDNNIEIFGGEIDFKREVNSYNDHRIVMAGATLATLSNKMSTIIDAEAIEKSYPTFFDDLKSLGGKIDAN